MRLFTNKRVRDIFIQIAQGTVTQQSLANAMHVSTRTIRSDLKALGEIIMQAGNRLIYDRKVGFSIQVDNPAGHRRLLEQSQKPWKETRSTRERRSALLTALLRQDKDVSLEQLESTWFISLYTLRNDITLLKRHFALYDIAVNCEGAERYKLQGSEIALRRCIYDHLLRAREPEEEFAALFNNRGQVADIKQALSRYVVAHGRQISDVNLRFFTLICAIASGRMQRGSWLLDFTFSGGEPTIKTAAAEIFALLCCEGASGLQSEIDYIAMNLAAFCTHAGDDLSENCAAECAVMNHFLSYVSASWFCDVFYDEASRSSLLNHIKAMRIRVNNGINIVNPLIEQIKRHYPLIYEMTLAAFSELEHFFSGRISDDEIGYLVMHIGAILEETHLKEATLSTLVISEQGGASARLVCQKITRMYPQLAIARYISVEQYNAAESIDENLVISFVTVAEKNRRVIHLPPLPERWQLENMKYFLHAETTPTAMVNYFSPEHFFVFTEHQHDKASLIHFLSAQLVRQGRVDERYLASVLEREERASTLLDDKIAIPHPLGLVALSTMVTVAVFPNGIEWDAGKMVKMVFMLAISEDAFVDSMLIYDYLTNILDDDVIDVLSQCASYPAFMSRSQKYFL